MNNQFIVALLLVISAIFGYMGYEQDKARQIYAHQMDQAVKQYLKDGTEVKVEKITIHDDEMAVATYKKGIYNCEAHVVHALTNPELGLFGEICTPK